ncbi:hypothetical protein B0G75_103573 [Paraburkholderia sp. BL18I3N2]|nr:hypothetical protein B0G75_103573 [Paraburkholderia sp. BL18I3N2]
MVDWHCLGALGQSPKCFIGHDLDKDNVDLLRGGKLSAVLHHDLRQDMRSACHSIMHFHKLLPASAVGRRPLLVGRCDYADKYPSNC